LASKGVKATLGPADAYYRKGLKHYYAGQYTEAIDDFDRTLSKSPDYPGLADLRTNAANLRQQRGDFSVLSGATLLWYIVGGVTPVLAAGAAFTFLVTRNRWPLRPFPLRPFSRRQRMSVVRTPPLSAAEPHFCAACGAELHPAEKYCPNCGKEISVGASA
jgi:serine protease Do